MKNTEINFWKNTPGLEDYAIKVLKGKKRAEALEDINKTFGLNINLGQYTSFIKNRNLSSGLGKPGNNKGKRFRWTDAEIEFLRTNRDMPDKEIAKICGKKAETVKRMRQMHGISKEDDGRFKKGNIPKDAVPLGTESVRKGIVYVKVKDFCSTKNFVQKSHIVYEEAYDKKVQKGYAIAYLDGNPANLNPGNLYLIRHKDLKKSNCKGVIKGCPEAREARLKIGQIKGRLEDIYEKYN